jgi:hypothetical protein
MTLRIRRMEEILSAQPLPETEWQHTTATQSQVREPLPHRRLDRIPPPIAISSYHFSETDAAIADCGLGNIDELLGETWPLILRGHKTETTIPYTCNQWSA